LTIVAVRQFFRYIYINFFFLYFVAFYCDSVSIVGSLLCVYKYGTYICKCVLYLTDSCAFLWLYPVSMYMFVHLPTLQLQSQLAEYLRRVVLNFVISIRFYHYFWLPTFLLLLLLIASDVSYFVCYLLFLSYLSRHVYLPSPHSYILLASSGSLNLKFLFVSLVLYFHIYCLLLCVFRSPAMALLLSLSLSLSPALHLALSRLLSRKA